MSEAASRASLLSPRVHRDMEHERYHPELEEELNRAMEEEQETEHKLADPETYADKNLSTTLLARYNELKLLCEKLFLDLEEIEGQIRTIEEEAGKGETA